jgi:Raf kinase inhibitor-like YbhB/YbcL family protein
MERNMQLTSAAFQAGGAIPSKFTCEGKDVSPEFSWRDAPAETKTFALVLHDPDAPRAGGFTHWAVYNIPANTGHIGEDAPRQERIPDAGMQGMNDAGSIGYMGPCPPSGTHRYFARLYALDIELPIAPGASHSELGSAMEGHILEEAELMGTYAKKSARAA